MAAATEVQPKFRTAARAPHPINLGSLVVQRIGDLDDPQFETATQIKFLGGNAEGVFLVGDGKNHIVVKPADAADRTVLAYNLAKDFNVRIPSARQVTTGSPQGAALLEKAKALEPSGRLAKGLASTGSAILMDFVPGEKLNELANYTSAFNEDMSMETIGRMLVFDAAVLNVDRFKLESGALANPGNVLVSASGPIGIDQDFAKINPPGFGDDDTVETYGPMIAGKMATKLQRPDALAAELVNKLLAQGIQLLSPEKAITAVARGITAGVLVLKQLMAKSNTRIEELVKWAHTFVKGSSLKSEEVREYWAALAQ